MVVIAGDPNPSAPFLHAADRCAFLLAEASGSADVVEAVAERNDCAGIEARDYVGEPRESLPSIVGRQELAPARERRAFFEVQVRDEQHVVLREIHGPGQIENGDDARQDGFRRWLLVLAQSRHAPRPRSFRAGRPGHAGTPDVMLRAAPERALSPQRLREENRLRFGKDLIRSLPEDAL